MKTDHNGIWANAPAMVALVEAVSFHNVPLGEIAILNIGTTSTPFSIAQHIDSSALE